MYEIILNNTKYIYIRKLSELEKKLNNNEYVTHKKYQDLKRIKKNKNIIEAKLEKEYQDYKVISYSLLTDNINNDDIYMEVIEDSKFTLPNDKYKLNNVYYKSLGSSKTGKIMINVRDFFEYCKLYSINIGMPIRVSNLRIPAILLYYNETLTKFDISMIYFGSFFHHYTFANRYYYNDKNNSDLCYYNGESNRSGINTDNYFNNSEFYFNSGLYNKPVNINSGNIYLNVGDNKLQKYGYVTLIPIPGLYCGYGQNLGFGLTHGTYEITKFNLCFSKKGKQFLSSIGEAPSNLKELYLTIQPKISFPFLIPTVGNVFWDLIEYNENNDEIEETKRISKNAMIALLRKREQLLFSGPTFNKVYKYITNGTYNNDLINIGIVYVNIIYKFSDTAFNGADGPWGTFEYTDDVIKQLYIDCYEKKENINNFQEYTLVKCTKNNDGSYEFKTLTESEEINSFEFSVK